VDDRRVSWVDRAIFEELKRIRALERWNVAELGAIRRESHRQSQLLDRIAVATEKIAESTEVDLRSVAWHVGVPEPE
jgi:hypothetical protein